MQSVTILGVKGLFVTLEGPEGAGKSTVANVLADRLRDAGQTVCLTREPGSGPLGPAIRSLLLDGTDVDDRTELFLFLADRAQHVSQIVAPALHRGEVVLCDRYADSTVVYQGHARGLNVDQLRQWNTFATKGLVPNLTLLLDLDPEVGLVRCTKGDRLDREPIEFHRRVRHGFLTESKLDPDRWVVVDASLDVELVVAQCWSAVSDRLAATGFGP